jgi:hypothetical protein
MARRHAAWRAVWWYKWLIPLTVISKRRSVNVRDRDWGAAEAVEEFLSGLRNDEGMGTPPLAAAASGRIRLRELQTATSARP